MDEIDAWFHDTGKRQRRVVGLYASLLRNRLIPYFFYRLRFLIVLQLLGFMLHVAEFLILFAHLQHLSVLLIFLLRAGALLLRGSWWGALEVMRERLRECVGANAIDESEAEISSWLVASLALATLLVVSALIFLFGSLKSLGADAATIRIYALLIVVELAVRFPIVTLHSGIYATRRVYRTFASMLLPNAVQLAVLAAVYFYDPTAALIVAIIAGTACSIIVTFAFTMRMYRVTGMAPSLVHGIRHFGSFLADMPVWHLILSAAAGFALRVDALLVLMLIGAASIGGWKFSLTAGHPLWNTPHIGIFLYLILPAIRGAYEWSVLFYFDLVRLRRAPALRDLERMFLRKLFLLAPILATFFWMLSLPVAYVAYRDIAVGFLVALFPLFAFRAWLALLQIRAFANGQLVLVCASVGVLALGLALVVTGEFANLDDIAQIAGCIAATALILLLAQAFISHPRPALLSLNDWCAQLGREPGPVQVGRLQLTAAQRPKYTGGVAELLMERLDGAGHCAWQGRSALVYYCRLRDGGAPVLDGSALVEETGGLIAGAELLGPSQPSGGAACDALLAHKWLGTTTADASDLDKLTRAFRAACPDGTAIDLHADERAAVVAGLPKDVVATALPKALGVLRSGSLFVPHAEANIFPLYVDCKLRMLFVAPASEDPPLSSPWIERLRAWQVSTLRTGTER